MPVTQKINSQDVISQLAGGLRQAAVRPNIYGYTDQPKQKEFSTSPAKGRLFIGGNRSGKTVAGAVEAVRWLTKKHPYQKTPEGQIKGRIVSVDFTMGVEKIVKPEIARWIPPSALINGSWTDSYNKELRTLTLADGSFVEFMSYDQDLEKFAGTSRHFIWYDEEPPRDIFTESNMRLIDVGGKWWISMTPVEGMSWTYDEIYLKAKTDPSFKIVEVDMTENQYLNPVEIEAALAGLTEDEKKARIHGKYVQLGGLIYKNFGTKNIVNPLNPKEKLAGWQHVASLDAGYNNPTAWLWGAVDKEGRIVIYDEHYESGQVVHYHAAVVRDRNAEHGFEPAYYVGDPSIRNVDPITGTSVLQEYVDNGIPLILGNHDVRAGLNRVATLIGDDQLAPQLFITSNCVNLINELAHYRWGTWATKKMQYDKNKKEEPHKKNDHAADSLRYLIMSRPQVENLSIPEKYNPEGVVYASSPYTDLKDLDLLPDSQLASVSGHSSDYHLGDEY